jgi:hypothetical protein
MRMTLACPVVKRQANAGGIAPDMALRRRLSTDRR